MFLRIVPIRRPSGKVVHYVQLVESYYDRGKIKQRTIANLERWELLAPHVDRLVKLLKGEQRKTMTEEKHLSAVEAVGAYKELSQVEWVFRKLKDVLETRPIYHHDPRAVPGPCLCCCLGLLARPTLGEKAKASQAPLFHRRGLDSPPYRPRRRGRGWRHQTPRGHGRKPTGPSDPFRPENQLLRALEIQKKNL
ncbi:hypothetical protein A7K72_02340 [Candidatus Methylacidiphilum fumarolicum]|uniref:Transposase n=1 Tax=Candidatus Methylacidiphilum fumarolicum TaxID=591154 RepID=A0ABN8XDF6_9BACT|nr:hypothetical protein [Candidatus Methylacidiphilum fumarolicum]TFE75165.1 hypothetical protein A7K72_02340 [Candidatus Methylacidiphilum fumarolicum]CAI9085286.1 protein of unknown function [Candidatus Methylacidiphilum fumarolicum]